jgi:hypothetical protein
MIIEIPRQSKTNNLFRQARTGLLALANRQSILFLYYSCFCLLFFCYNLQNPRYNWDMIAYVALASYSDTSDTAARHENVYRSLSKSVPSNTYETLAHGTTSRTLRSSSPAVFDELLYFYKIRVVYIGLIRIGSYLGVSPFFASYLISALAASLGFFLLFLTFKPYMAPWLMYLLPAFAVNLGLSEIAQLSTPDALAFLALVVSIFLFLRNHWLFPISLPAMVLVRTDLIIFPLVFSLLMFYRGYFKQIVALASFVASLLIYLWLNYHFSYPGWTQVFAYTCIFRSDLAEAQRYALSLHDYFWCFPKGVWHALTSQSFLLFLVFGGIGAGFVASSARNPKSAELQRLIDVWLASILFVAAHFVVLPVIWERFFVGPYLFTLCCSLCLISRMRNTNESLHSTTPHVSS